MNFPVTSWRALCGELLLARLAGRPRLAESLRAASAAALASSSVPAAPAGELVGDLAGRGVDERAGAEHHLGRLELGELGAAAWGSSRSPSAGTLPERQPSSLISRPRSGVSTVCWRSPFTSTTTASSPNSRLKSSVAFATSDERETRVSVPALRLESAAPARRRQRRARPRRRWPPAAAGDGAHERRESLSPHAVSLGSYGSDAAAAQLRVTPGLADQTPERRLLAARRRPPGRVAREHELARSARAASGRDSGRRGRAWARERPPAGRGSCRTAAGPGRAGCRRRARCTGSSGWSEMRSA